MMMMSMIGVRTESVNIISKQVRREGRLCHVWELMSVYSYSRLSLCINKQQPRRERERSMNNNEQKFLNAVEAKRKD